MFELFASLLPLLKAVSPHLFTITTAILVAYVVLRERAVSRLLPPAVRKLVEEPYVTDIIKFCAMRVDLDNPGKRAESVKRIDAYFQSKGFDVPERSINLALELIVSQLKADGILPATADPQPALKPL